ncbi:MAG: DNA-directed RNA polymerase subunit D [Euryarchaeota archaeon RBG_13_31_8]|nr:MAG: DNA-directed RNA polymerase subunit D [Euryarchaeota archaeon RBG_13_31_8]
MKLDILELKPKKAVLKIEDTKPYFINSIRRVMLSELPKLAVDDVVIYDNTSALFDEIIAHRLSLIPIPTELDLITFRAECVCKGKGCPNCTVRYTLSKEGGGTVFSGDLQPAEKSWAIKEDKIPIVELYGDQRLILEVEATLGRGRDHAKWQAVIAPGYRMETTIEFDKKRLNDAKEFLSKLPEGTADIKGDKIILKNDKKLATLQYHMEKENVDFITITKDPTKVTFSFETDGSFTTKDALIESVKILGKKYTELSKLLKEI